RAIFKPPKVISRSSGWPRKLGSISGDIAGSAEASRTEPRAFGRRLAVFSVTPGFFILATPASIPDPWPRWNWMSGDRADGSAYQNPPTSNRLEATGPFL